MVGINGLSSLYNQYDVNRLKKNKTAEKAETSEVKKTETKKAESTESKLSDKGKEYLKTLREKYKDYDFIIADTKEDQDALAAASDKEISVMISSSELEKMAEDEEYGNERLKQMEDAVEMSKKLMDELAEKGDLDDDTGINKITIELADDGSIKLFAELEKSSAKQRERIQANREKQKEEAKAEEKKTKASAYEKSYEKNEEYRQRTTVEASSAEELLEKIRGIDWTAVPYDEIKTGEKIDFAV
ncbi:DUF6033 family protein [Pseudobutyrivibrio xylanivorans]|uniref:Uncharacterized protein n=1 Tax=Pseudobutyrivibrio xylanivorans TaxID=185007 RepID=A0A5P6VPH6_PSEXY|nr:DUF6033 family protein [Pseudobutyrivibrio xylanivorans]QFJ54467.1 hypothetical protein FXF36_06135 [Pseudobutyrivibrio xylanivorans]